ncbi:MAG: hypothetical protein PHS44_02435 [Candidatus Dojkabacteria bacterium]|nr:hypothetical protein [Candidatus Dojkabacteria bacterium]
MESDRIRRFIHSVLLLIFGVFEIILLIRITLRLIGASVESSFVSFWYDLSKPIFNFYEGTLGELVSGKIVFEVDSIIGVIIFIVATLVAVKIVNGVFEPSFKGKMQSFLDSLFKIAEIILGMRLVFKLLGAGKSSFIAILYGISSIFYEPFKGILPTIETESLILETATLVAIVIIVILDYMSDKLIQEIFKVDSMPTGASSSSTQSAMSIGQQTVGNSHQGYQPQFDQSGGYPNVNQQAPVQQTFQPNQHPMQAPVNNGYSAGGTANQFPASTAQSQTIPPNQTQTGNNPIQDQNDNNQQGQIVPKVNGTMPEGNPQGTSVSQAPVEGQVDNPYKKIPSSEQIPGSSDPAKPVDPSAPGSLPANY